MIDEKGSFKDPDGKINYENSRVFRKLTAYGIERFLKLKEWYNFEIFSKRFLVKLKKL